MAGAAVAHARPKEQVASTCLGCAKGETCVSVDINQSERRHRKLSHVRTNSCQTDLQADVIFARDLQRFPLERIGRFLKKHFMKFVDHLVFAKHLLCKCLCKFMLRQNLKTKLGHI